MKLRTIKEAVVKNTLNPITLVVGVLGGMLWSVGRGQDALFLLSTVILNTLVATVQEVRARTALDSLSLLQPKQARKVTASGMFIIPLYEVVVGDELLVEKGDPIQVDGKVLTSSELQVTESQLTGESREISKKVRDELFAGSSVVTGSGTMRVTAIGPYTKLGSMERSLKQVTNTRTPLQRDLARLLQLMGIIALFLALSVSLDSYLTKTSLPQTLSILAASVMTLVPQGLILASTLLATYGAVRLGRHNILVQQLNAIETFGRLQVLCVDKTGTLTDLQAKLEQIVPHFPYTEHRLQRILRTFADTPETSSQTTEALTRALPTTEPLEVLETLAFSSSRRFSALKVREQGKSRCISFGAPEAFHAVVHLSSALQKSITEATSKGKRVLLLVDHGTSHATKSLAEHVHEGGHCMGYIVLDSPLREGTTDTAFFLQGQGIILKVISGDAPATVLAVAKQAGIRNTEYILTGDELAMLDPIQRDEIIAQTTIFARILPEQKEQIISSLKKRYEAVGMIGDGVNDSLALKRADIGIAMEAGSSATKTVADIILLDNSFSSLPIVIRTSDQVLVALQQVTSIFGLRIVYTITLTLISLLIPYLGAYPLETKQLILINWLTVGLPTLLWSLSPPEASSRFKSDEFFRQVARYSIPVGVVVGAITGLAWIFAETTNPLLATTAVTATLCISALATAWYMPRALGAIESIEQRHLRLLLIVGCIALLATIAVSPTTSLLFGLTQNWIAWVIGACAGAAAWTVTGTLAHLLFPKTRYTL